MKSLSEAVRRGLAVLTIAIVVLACGITAGAQSNLPPTWVFARAYNGWNIVGQQANTFTFNGGACNYSPYNNGQSPSFFVFSGYQNTTQVFFPVAIVDANSAVSEIATPTATVQTGSSCGFSGGVLNAHTSFTLQSGTAGLQEAIVTQQQSAPVFNVILDKYWYQSVSALPGAPAPASIIAAVTGNANVGIVDTTTMPWTSYTWNGSKYVASAAFGSVSYTSLTVVPAPTALSTSATVAGIITTAATGGTLPASSTYRLAATYVTANGGETTISTDSASTATIQTGGTTATNTITVTSPAAATGAVGWRLYMTAASGSTGTGILYTASCASASTGQTVLNGVCAIGSSATVTAVLTGTAKEPAVSSAFIPTSASTSPLQNVMASYPPFTNTGAVSTGTPAYLAVVNLPAGYFNVLGRTVKMCGAGFSTTTTTGTLTLATLLASVPGVTSITPFTALSGSITSASTVNFNFCETWTTAATGATGTLEAHGWVNYTLAATAVSSPTQDNIAAVSSTLDLTKQDQLEFTLTGGTSEAIASGGAQLRQLTIEVLQ